MTAFPPPANTTTQNVIPQYLYVEYNDDPNLQAFVAAYNAYAQAYLTYLNGLNLPIYTNGNIVGPLLDWVAAGIYGLIRPTLSSSGSPSVGPFNTWEPNTIPINGFSPGVTSTFFATTDDIFKRIMTWRLYTGDGRQFSIRWLKNRIWRFLNGVNGTDPPITNTYGISVSFTAAQAATITLATTSISTIFAEAVASGAVELPFQITWTVTLT